MIFHTVIDHRWPIERVERAQLVAKCPWAQPRELTDGAGTMSVMDEFEREILRE